MAATRLDYRNGAGAGLDQVAGEGQIFATTPTKVFESDRSRLGDLAKLASTEIRTSLVANLSGDLHNLFDPVSDGVLPIYFGPLLGRLYLEGL